MSPRWFLAGSLGFTLLFNVAWAWGTGWLSVIAAGSCTLIVPAGLHLWRQVPAGRWYQRGARDLVLAGVCLAALVTSFSHSVAVLLAAGWTEVSAWSVTGGMELLVALSTMAVSARRTPVPDVQDGEELEGARVRVAVRGFAPCSVYRLRGADDALLYVGITGNLRRRLADHRTAKPWWPEVEAIEVETFGSRREALSAERDAIAGEAPRYNLASGSTNDSAAAFDSRDEQPADTPHEQPPNKAPDKPAERRPTSSARRLSAVPPVSDDDLLADFQEWSAGLNEAPSGSQVRKRYGVGYDRANRLLAALDRDADDSEGDRADRVI